MNNAIQKKIDSNFEFLKDVLKPESAENNKKQSSFYDDYVQRTNQSLRETINKYITPLPELKPISQTQQTTDKIPQYTKFSGSTIKKKIRNVLSQKYGELDTRNLFDGIDDKDVEDNIQTAENTIKTNIDRGVLSKSTLPKLPNLRDGLALSYAAANKGKSRAATRAREAAYMEKEEPLVKSTKTNMLSTELPKPQSIPKTTAQKPSTAKLMGSVDEKPKTENFVWKPEKEINVPKFINSNNNLNSTVGLKMLNANVTPENSAGIRFKDMMQRTNNESKPLYSGNIWGNKPQEDLYYSDLNTKQLTEVKGVTWLEKVLGNDYHEKMFRNIGNITSINDKSMKSVINDMIDHFFDGTGTDYSNPILTDKVKKHDETKRYMKDFAQVFHSQLQKNNGDISKLLQSDNFRTALKDSGVLLSTYDYYGTKDKINGLTMAIHSWTESNVDIQSFKISQDGSYSGTLKFTFKDNFGLDKEDIEKFYLIPGFASWFVLQHNYENSGKYKPFKTVVEIEYPISGKIKGYKYD